MRARNVFSCDAKAVSRAVAVVSSIAFYLVGSPLASHVTLASSNFTSPEESWSGFPEASESQYMHIRHGLGRAASSNRNHKPIQLFASELHEEQMIFPDPGPAGSDGWPIHDSNLADFIAEDDTSDPVSNLLGFDRLLVKGAIARIEGSGTEKTQHHYRLRIREIWMGAVPKFERDKLNYYRVRNTRGSVGVQGDYLLGTFEIVLLNWGTLEGNLRPQSGPSSVRHQSVRIDLSHIEGSQLSPADMILAARHSLRFNGSIIVAGRMGRGLESGAFLCYNLYTRLR